MYRESPSSAACGDVGVPFEDGEPDAVLFECLAHDKTCDTSSDDEYMRLR